MTTRLWLIALLFCWTLAAAPAYAGPPIGPPESILLTTDQYRTIYAAIAVDIVSANLAANEKLKTQRVREALSELAPIVRCDVIYGDSIVFIDNRPLRNTLLRSFDRHTPDSRRKVLVSALVKQTQLVQSGFLAAVVTDRPAAAGDSARAVLRQREFGSDPYPPPSWLDKHIDNLGDWISRLIKRLTGRGVKMPTGHIDPAIAKVLLITIGTLAAALLCYLLVKSLSDYAARRQMTLGKSILSSSLAMNELEATLVSARDFDQLIGLAKESAGKGEFRTAYRLIFLATLVLLDTTGDVRLHRSKTNWEYVAGIRKAGNDPLYNLMLPLTEEFDRIWYGFGDVDRQDFFKANEKYELVKQLVLPDRAAAESRQKAST